MARTTVTLGGKSYALSVHPSLSLRMDVVAARAHNGFRGLAACLAVALPHAARPKGVSYRDHNHDALAFGGSCLDAWLRGDEETGRLPWRMPEIMRAGQAAYELLSEGLDDLWAEVEEVEGNSDDPASDEGGSPGTNGSSRPSGAGASGPDGGTP